MNELTKNERKQLKDHEATIEREQKSFIAMGQALMAIKDGRLYRQEWGTFECYMQDRWGYSRAWGYQLIDSTEVVEGMSSVIDISPPQNVTQALELTKLDSDQKRADAWTKANKMAEEKGKPVTAAMTRKAVGEVLGKKPKPKEEKPPKPKKPPAAKKAPTTEFAKGKQLFGYVDFYHTQLVQAIDNLDDVCRHKRKEEAIDLANQALRVVKNIYEDFEKGHKA